eukprot:3580072-Rhodomonas_salina.1
MNLAALTRALPERLASEYRALALSERAGACVILLQNTTWGTVARLVRRRSELESQPRHWTQKEDLTVYTPRYSCTYLLRLRPETEDQGYTRDHFLSQNIRIPSPNPDQTHPLRGALDHKPPRLLTPEGWERETLRARIVGQNSRKNPTRRAVEKTAGCAVPMDFQPVALECLFLLNHHFSTRALRVLTQLVDLSPVDSNPSRFRHSTSVLVNLLHVAGRGPLGVQAKLSE